MVSLSLAPLPSWEELFLPKNQVHMFESFVKWFCDVFKCRRSVVSVAKCETLSCNIRAWGKKETARWLKLADHDWCHLLIEVNTIVEFIIDAAVVLINVNTLHGAVTSACDRWLFHAAVFCGEQWSSFQLTRLNNEIPRSWIETVGVLFTTGWKGGVTHLCQSLL